MTKITTAAAKGCLHMLAGLNHYQWNAWQPHSLPQLQIGDTVAIAELLAGNFPADLDGQLVKDADDLVELAFWELFGPGNKPPTHPAIIERKRKQFLGWMQYAAKDKTLEHYARWERLSQTPFLELTPKEQKSDYVEAVADLEAIATAYGLVLPQPLPQVEPLTGWAARWRRFHHRRRRHGRCSINIGWNRHCTACHGHMVTQTP